MVKVITIEREFGSGGGAIAAALAEKLNWKLWDQAITGELAKRLKCNVAAVEKREERLDPAFYRLMKTFMRGSYEAGMQGSGLDLLDADHLVRLSEKVISSIAEQGNCVIVGRGAPWFVRDRTDCLNVFVFARPEDKVRRLRKLGRSTEEAQELVETVDRERAAFIKKYFGKDWPSRELYHLMVNSSIGQAHTLDTILEMKSRLDGIPSSLADLNQGVAAVT